MKETMKDYGFIVEEGGLICPACADNPIFNADIRAHNIRLERVEKEGYPDGYTCNDCGKVVE